MNRRSVRIDFSDKCGKVKPVSALNGSPLVLNEYSTDLTELYKNVNTSMVRLADTGKPYGLNQYLDIHAIFPDFSLDERFELSYNFAPTDKLILAIANSGASVYLRLGESIDKFAYKPHLHLPRDLDKYARICQHIISHYNEGWANGYKLKIKYVEIWQSPDTEDGFADSEEKYFELYSVVACHLKSRFPKLKVGAYSMGGFRAMNHFDADENERGYLEYLERFLSYINNREENVPLDFLSWKCEADEPEEISLHCNYAMSYLSGARRKRTESIISEFSVRTKEDIRRMREYPALLGSSFIIAQKSSVSAMFYSTMLENPSKNGIWSTDVFGDIHLFSGYYALEAMGRLSRLDTLVRTGEDYRREIYTLAATSESDGAILLCSRYYDGVVDIELENHAFRSYSVIGVIGGGRDGAGCRSSREDLQLNSSKISLKMGKNQLFLITLK